MNHSMSAATMPTNYSSAHHAHLPDINESVRVPQVRDREHIVTERGPDILKKLKKGNHPYESIILPHLKNPSGDHGKAYLSYEQLPQMPTPLPYFKAPTPQKTSPPEYHYVQAPPPPPLKPVVHKNKTPFNIKGKESLISNKRSQDHIYSSPDLNIHKPVRMTVKEVDRAKYNAKKYGVNKTLREYDLKGSSINARPSVFDKYKEKEMQMAEARTQQKGRGRQGYNSVKPTRNQQDRDQRNGGMHDSNSRMGFAHQNSYGTEHDRMRTMPTESMDEYNQYN